jgi:hypothetical protein
MIRFDFAPDNESQLQNGNARSQVFNRELLRRVTVATAVRLA